MGRKEELIKKVQRLRNDLVHIRDIGTAAHIDHGKCVAPYTRICLADNILPAAQLFKLCKTKGKLKIQTENELIYDCSSTKLQVLSLNKETGRIEKKPVKYAWKLRNDKPLIKIKTKNGLEISTTPEHKYLVYNGMDFVEKTAESLVLNDRIVSVRNLELDENLELFKERTLNLLTQPGFYVKLDLKFGGKIKSLILSYGIKKIASDISTDLKPKSLYHGAWQNRYRLVDLVRICKLLNLDKRRLYKGIAEIAYRKKGGRRVLMKFPKTSNDFTNLFYLAGLMLGDGSYDRFTAGKTELADKFIEICRTFSLKAKQRKYKNKTPVVFPNGGATFIKLLHLLFNYPAKKKSHNLSLSNYVLTAPKQYLVCLLRGYFDTDGCVEKARRAVTLTSASSKILKDLQLALLRLNCLSSLNDDTLYISGVSVNPFTKIGFNLSAKSERLHKLQRRITGSYLLDAVPMNVKFKELRENGSLPKASITPWYYRYENEEIVPSLSSFSNFVKKFENLGVDINCLRKFITGDIAYIEIEQIATDRQEFVYDFTVEDNHNFIAEGVVIHNTTLSDNLLAGAGMISEQLAGKQLFLDYDEQEQARGITINAANASMVHEYEGKEYLINLIDTPGHVDFGGDVTRAMRALDGVIIVVCAVEGVMPQTETVVRQAMKEKVKPILFINKVDRLINELKVTPEQMQQKFKNIITRVNELINKMASEELKDKWLVRVEDGSVCFGSAYHKWGLSAPFTKKTGVTFKEIYDYCSRNAQAELSELAPLHKVILDAVVRHLPPPTQAQKYRIPQIWKGNLESEVGKAMLNCDAQGPLALMITKIIMDPHAGEVAVGRIYGGTVRKGQRVRIIGMPNEYAVQQVAISVGADRLPVQELSAGNIVAITGVRDAAAGVTITTSPEMEAFEKIVHYSEPVVTVAIEAKRPTDLPKLVEVLRSVAKADPSLQVEINQETGEHLLSGMGELHLEITEYRITHEHKVDIEVSKPIVVYREGVLGQGGPFEGKSPNRHNKFYLTVEPLEEKVVQAIQRAEIKTEGKIKDKRKLAKQLQELGMSKEDSKNVNAFHKTNVFIDATWGIQYLHETIELCAQAFHEAMDGGPLAKEKCMGLKVKLVDAKLHEDSIHRGPAQVIPAVRNAIYGAMCQAKRVILEPRQKVFINVPPEVMGDVTREMQQRRATMEDIKQEGDLATIISNAPVAEMFGFATSIRSATAGRVLWTTEHAGFEKTPFEIQAKVVREIRVRKGLKPEPYDEAYYAS